MNRIRDEIFSAIKIVRGNIRHKEQTQLWGVVFISLTSLFLLNFVVIRGLLYRTFVAHFGIVAGDETLTRMVVWTLGCIVAYVLLPVTFCLVSGKKISSTAIHTKGYFTHLPYYLLVYIPYAVGIFLASSGEEFINTYPFYSYPESYTALILWELLYSLQFISLEFFFRGFLIHSMKRFGTTAALLIMIFPYFMIHFQKPPLEAATSVLLGLFLGFMSLRSNSIWGGVTLHLLIALTLDLCALWRKGWFFA